METGEGRRRAIKLTSPTSFLHLHPSRNIPLLQVQPPSRDTPDFVGTAEEEKNILVHLKAHLMLCLVGNEPQPTSIGLCSPKLKTAG